MGPGFVVIRTPLVCRIFTVSYKLGCEAVETPLQLPETVGPNHPNAETTPAASLTKPSPRKRQTRHASVGG